MFEKVHINLGIIKIGKPIKIEFPYNKEYITMITSIEAPCDCADTYNNHAEGKIEVNYKPKGVPEHLRLEGKHSYAANKKITVWYNTKVGTSEPAILTFEAIVRE